VWPLERRRHPEVLLLGRKSVQRFSSPDRQSLVHVAEHSIEPLAAGDCAAMTDALVAMCRTRAPDQATLVVESAWMPTMLVDTGSGLLRSAELEALVRHRLGLYHADVRDPVSAWELRIEHRVGTRYALAYALSPQVKEAVLSAARSQHFEWSAITPAMAWGLERLRPAKNWSSGTGWWLWPEQDRTLIARLTSSGLVGLNPAAPRLTGNESVVAAVESECIRLGLGPPTGPISAATLGEVSSAPRRADGCTWVGVCGPLGGKSRTTALAVPTSSVVKA
jgi:hypothetical protein